MSRTVTHFCVESSRLARFGRTATTLLCHGESNLGRVSELPRESLISVHCVGGKETGGARRYKPRRRQFDRSMRISIIPRKIGDWEQCRRSVIARNDNTLIKQSRTVSSNSVTFPTFPQIVACTDGYIAWQKKTTTTIYMLPRTKASGGYDNLKTRSVGVGKLATWLGKKVCFKRRTHPFFFDSKIDQFF